MKNKGSKILYSLIKILIFLIRLIPSRIALKLSAASGKIVGKFCKEETAIAKAQLQLLCKVKKTKVEIESIVSANFSHIGKTVYESLIIDRLLEFKNGLQVAKSFSEQPYKYIEFLNDPKILDQILENDSSCIILSAHLGCFELLAACAAKFEVNQTKRKLIAIGRNPNFSVADLILKDIRDAYGMQTIWRNDPRAGMKLAQLIKQKNWLAVLIDQDINLKNQFYPFLGLPAAYPVTPILLAIKYSIPIVSAFIVRQDTFKYLASVKPIKYDSQSETAVTQILSAYTRHLESLLLEYPEQWVWWHRRWRRRPEGGKIRTTAEYLKWLETIKNNL
jgi:KDO2-lipid IV(A) lauroyltransferase